NEGAESLQRMPADSAVNEALLPPGPGRPVCRRTRMNILRILLGLARGEITVNLGWRLASRKWSLPCPTGLAWVLEHPAFQGILGTTKTLDRIGLRAGQRIVEI